MRNLCYDELFDPFLKTAAVPDSQSGANVEKSETSRFVGFHLFLGAFVAS